MKIREHKNYIFGLLSISFIVSTIAIANVRKPFIVNSELGNYSLVLNSSQKISTESTYSENEISHNVVTNNRNNIQLKGYKVINNQNGWQTVLPGGYFYNPVTQLGDNNKLSGIKSITYIGNGSLELHYGYSANNKEILYSFENTLTANTKFSFAENNPSYFYLKNVTGSNIDIEQIEIEYSCIAQDFPNNNLKVLMIGNSFSDDTVYYATRVAASLGIGLEIYDAYIGGCTIDTHYSNIQSGNIAYSLRSMNGASWNYQNDMSLNDIVTYKDWDIITFQQASAQIGRSNSYSNLENLVNSVKSLVTGNPKYYWHQTWAYDNDYSEYYDYFSYFNNNQETMFSAIVDCYNSEVVPTNLFEKTIFNGTAVQNVRSSYMGDTICRDGKHMSNVHGRYLLSCNFISTIYGIDLSLSPVNYRPDGISTSYQNLVNEAINNARKYPNNTTQSVYTSELYEQYDLANYTEIDGGLVGCSYYYSQDSTNYANRINYTSGTSNKYVTTSRFTPSTLPIGSLVFIKEGYGYRPEAWVDNSPQSFRKGETYDPVIEIDEDFWNGYQYRAFNIFKAGKSALAAEYVDEQYSDIFDGFHIFVPNDKLDGLPIKGSNPKLAEDSNVFNANGYDINNYHRLHLDPITGFYNCSSYYYLLNSYTDDTAKKFVCTRPFFATNNDLPAGSIIVTDSGYQWRSDCWKEKATYSPRPNNVTSNFYVTDSSFMSPYRRRTFNVSATNSSYVNGNYINFLNHVRIYLPN